MAQQRQDRRGEVQAATASATGLACFIFRFLRRPLKGRTPTAEERTIANALGTLPCIACYMHGVISEEVSLHHISGRTAPGCHKKQLPLCRWHHQHAAPAEVREKYPWLVPVHADGVVGGKKEFTLLNKSEMELLADAYEMANIMH